MPRFSRLLGLSAAVVAIAAAPSVTVPDLSAKGEPSFAGVSLKIKDETVEPGAIVQAKLFVTEPKPISTARNRLRLAGFSTLDGIALMSPAGDTLGVAVVSGSELALSILSPSATFGTNPDYPVVTVAGRVAATTPLGTTFPLEIDEASLQLTDPSGAVYPTHAKDGVLEIAPNVGVDDVTPGSAVVPEGGLVTILGRNFRPTTRVKFEEMLLSEVAYVDSSHIQVRVAQPTRMHGQGIRIVNRDGAETKYFSYQRTARQGTSIHPTLRVTVPIFSDIEYTDALVDVDGATTGLALQNRQAVAALAAAELFDANGVLRAAAAVTVRPGRFVLAELSELFGVAYSPSQVVRVRAVGSIQVMGVAVDAAGNASPIRPR
jgi:hypothetical protein